MNSAKVKMEQLLKIRGSIMIMMIILAPHIIKLEVNKLSLISVVTIVILVYFACRGYMTSKNK